MTKDLRSKLDAYEGAHTGHRVFHEHELLEALVTAIEELSAYSNT